MRMGRKSPEQKISMHLDRAVVCILDLVDLYNEVGEEETVMELQDIHVKLSRLQNTGKQKEETVSG